MSKFRYTCLFVLTCLAAVVAVSCAGDLGNYDYSELDEPVISGLETQVSVMRDESLELVPVISGGLGDGAYTYEWKAIGQDGDYVEEILGTDKNLSVSEVKLFPGIYSLYYTLTEKETGVYWRKEMTLTVSTPMSEGWMVLCSEEGRARLDFVSDVKASGKKYYIDVLKDNKDMPVFENPRKIMWLTSNTDASSPYYLLAGNGATRLGKDAFEWTEEYDIKYEMGSNVSVAPYDIVSAWSLKLMVNGTDVHYCSIISDDIGGMYGSPVNKNFRAAPYIGTNAALNSMSMVAVFLLYDIDNKCFMAYSPMLADKEFNEQPLADMYRMEHTATSQNASNVITSGFDSYPEGMEFIYMENTRWDPINAGMGVTYTVLSDGDKRYVYGIQLGDILRLSSSKYAIVRSYKGDISRCMDIDKAEFFAFSSIRSYMYYSVGNKIYGVSLDESPDDSRVMLELPGNITMMKFNLYQKNDEQRRSNDLIVGFEKGGEGQFWVYEGGFDANGDFSNVTPLKYDGGSEGKFSEIVDVCYKERN